MKIKVDFVTNSSSAAFVILKENLSQIQIDLIYNHIEMAKAIAARERHSLCLEEWQIKETETTIEGFTSMDNFDMHWYFEKVGIDNDIVEWDSDNDYY
jgi:hypothetical protein